MLNGANPLFTAIVAAVMARELPARGVSAGLAVGLAGTALMAVPGLNEGRNSAGGILMILAAVVSYGFALNLARPLQQRHGALPVIWRAQLGPQVIARQTTHGSGKRGATPGCTVSVRACGAGSYVLRSQARIRSGVFRRAHRTANSSAPPCAATSAPLHTWSGATCERPWR